jgi:tetratricopeptide (TPR) repeat protein
MLASALSRPTAALVGRVFGRDPHPFLDAAVEAQIATVDEEAITFAHPLFAAAVYGLLTPARRRHLHRQLASVVSDVEERARHLALAADAPDRAVSAALEDAARHAHARGALPSATELSEQARRLTPADETDDGHRRTILAVYALEAGEPVRARDLLEQALALTPSGPRRAEAISWLGALEERHGDLHRGAELLRESLAQAGDDLALRPDRGLARRRALPHAQRSRGSARSRTVGSRPRPAGRQQRAEVSALAEEALVAALLGQPN